jgi:NAD/NADP transhydrogenase beta subunit
VGRELGPWLVGAGVVAVVLGVLAWTGALSWFGRLPGDIRIESEHTRIYVPIASLLIVSLVLNIVIWLIRR